MVVIPTGSKHLDGILGGGLRSDAITLMFGHWATGKTQLGYQLMINALAMFPEKKAVYIETESGIFSPDRLKQIVPTVKTPKLDFSDRLLLIPASSMKIPAHQYLAYQRVQKLLEGGEKISLLVVDSFTALFRGFFPKRVQLADRNQEFAKHFTLLNWLSSKYNLAVYLTAQVQGVPTSPQEQKMALGRPENIVYGLKGFKFWGGPLPLHSAAYVLSLSRAKGQAWRARVIDSPDLPEAECLFSILPEGVRDYIGK